MQVISVKDKHDTYLLPASTPQELEASALKLVRERLADSYYYNYDEGEPVTQFRDRARQIVETENGKEAWDFLCEREDHEYEYVELKQVG
jgi:hypothetical protein